MVPAAVYRTASETRLSTIRSSRIGSLRAHAPLLTSWNESPFSRQVCAAQLCTVQVCAAQVCAAQVCAVQGLTPRVPLGDTLFQLLDVLFVCHGYPL
jgi:hypothetical protein